MGQILKNIVLFDKNFSYYKEDGQKITYKYQDFVSGELSILELFLTDDNKIHKINIDTFIEGLFFENICIDKDIDGKIILDYYPQFKEYVIVDASKKLYNISISKYLDLNNLNVEFLELNLKRKDNRNKLLTRVVSSEYFSTKGKKLRKIHCDSLVKLDKIAEYLTIELMDIEEKMHSAEETTGEMSDNNAYEPTTEFLPYLYVYDRSYDLVGIQKNVLLYRNMEEDIQDLEITLSESRDKIIEVKISRYQTRNIEEIQTDIHLMEITMKKDDNELINSSFISRNNGYMQIESPKIQEKLGKTLSLEFFNFTANDVIGENGLQDGKIEFNTKDFGEFSLIKDTTRNHYFYDSDNNEYRICQSTYALYDMIIQYSKGIMRNLEKNLLPSEKEKTLIKE